MQLRDVRVAYPGGVQALAPTRLDVAPGEFLVLLGASGAGKSTLLRCLTGLVRPTAGEVRANNVPGGVLTSRHLREHRRRCGMVFQQHHLIGRLRLLADEPVASLDPATAESVMSLLHRICKGDRLTAVVSLHQVGLARRYADRIVGLRGGRVVFDGPPEALTAQREAELYGAPAPQRAAPEVSNQELPCSAAVSPLPLSL